MTAVTLRGVYARSGGLAEFELRAPLMGYLRLWLSQYVRGETLYWHALFGLHLMHVPLFDELRRAAKSDMLAFGAAVMDTLMQSGLTRESEEDLVEVALRLFDANVEPFATRYIGASPAKEAVDEATVF